MAYYAWTRVQAGNKSADYGDPVTAAKLGISGEQFEAHVASGAFRSHKPPKLPDTWQGSPIDYLRQQATLAAEGAIAEVETVIADLDEEESKDD